MANLPQYLSEPTLLRIKRLLFVACLVPFLRLAAGGFGDGLGANPVETLTRSTGIWALNFLFITLAVTPCRQLTGCCWLVRFRRMLALYSFFYACLHFGTYLVFEQFFDCGAIVEDIGKRPYIAAGFLAFALLIPLAATSTDRMMRRLGGRRWRSLHRLVFPIAMVAVFHYLWLVKRDLTGPAWYALLLCLLLLARAMGKQRPAVPARSPVASAAGSGGPGSVAPQRSHK